MRIPSDFKGFDLRTVMERLQEAGEPGLKDFFLTLKEAKLLVPCKANKEDLGVLTSPDGSNVIPAFTRAEELVDKPVQWEDVIVMSIDELKHILVDAVEIDAIALNPFGNTLILKREQLMEMDRAVSTFTVERTEFTKPHDMKLMESYPRGLKKALDDNFWREPRLRTIWVVWAKQENEKDYHLLVVADFEGDRKEFFPKIANIIAKFLNRGDRFEMVDEPELIKKVKEITKPIYGGRFH